jgi:hypothetical protein
MQLDDRAAADNFVANKPMNKVGVYRRVEISPSGSGGSHKTQLFAVERWNEGGDAVCF